MLDTLEKALGEYHRPPGMEKVMEAHARTEKGTPETLARKYAEYNARAGQPLYVVDYLPFTNFDLSRKAELLIQAHSGLADRLAQLAQSAGHPVLEADYNNQAVAERQHVDHLTKLLSQLSLSSG